MTWFNWKPQKGESRWDLWDEELVNVLESLRFDHDTGVYRDSKGMAMAKKWDDALAAVERRFKKRFK